MKTLTQTFEEILKNLDPEGKNYPEVFNNLVKAVKARDDEQLVERIEGMKKACKPSGGCWDSEQFYCDKHNYFNEALDRAIQLIREENDGKE